MKILYFSFEQSFMSFVRRLQLTKSSKGASEGKREDLGLALQLGKVKSIQNIGIRLGFQKGNGARELYPDLFDRL